MINLKTKFAILFLVFIACLDLLDNEGFIEDLKRIARLYDSPKALELMLLNKFKSAVAATGVFGGFFAMLEV